jgi:hypothetical protein
VCFRACNRVRTYLHKLSSLTHSHTRTRRGELRVWDWLERFTEGMLRVFAAGEGIQDYTVCASVYIYICVCVCVRESHCHIFIIHHTHTHLSSPTHFHTFTPTHFHTYTTTHTQELDKLCAKELLAFQDNEHASFTTYLNKLALPMIVQDHGGTLEGGGGGAQKEKKKTGKS